LRLRPRITTKTGRREETINLSIDHTEPEMPSTANAANRPAGARMVVRLSSVSHAWRGWGREVRAARIRCIGAHSRHSRFQLVVQPPSGWAMPMIRKIKTSVPVFLRGHSVFSVSALPTREAK
jgi:hypothetical protein